MKQPEIEQMRARVAAAWGVDVGEVTYLYFSDIISRDTRSNFKLKHNGYKISYCPERGGIHVLGDLYEITKIAGNISLNRKIVAKYLVGYGIVARIAIFAYCMDYDIQFLIDAGVTITAGEQLEWALQMRDAGHPLTPKELE